MRRRSQDTRRKVLDCATAVFARKGYAGASVDELLQATGLSKPTLYYHFGSKEGLFQAILEFAYDESNRRVEAASRIPGNCQERLVEIVAALFVFTREYQSMVRLVLGSLFAGSEEIPARAIDEKRRTRNFALFAEIMQEGLQAGEFSSAFSVDELSRGIIGMATHLIRMHLLDGKIRLDRARAHRLVQLFLEGARPRS